MTKREKNFADDDRAMARRALWLIKGNPPNGEPPEDLDLDELHSCLSEEHGFLLPLAHFGMIRHSDAIRDVPPRALLEPEPGKTPAVTEARQRMSMHAAACLDEKQADDELRAASIKLQNALESWRHGLEKRPDGFGRTAGEHLAVLASLLAAEKAMARAMALVRRLRRRPAPPGVQQPFPSTLGLPQSERTLLLNAQARRLADAGHSLEEIAYVMGWDTGSPQHVRDRTRKRLQVATGERVASSEK